ncbi:cysteine-rich small domain protein [Clostridioides difficile Y401]|nr:cysteine-rich small domain protein [Clostridioides difficile Y401]
MYALGENCGGNFKYTDKGIKDCSSCMLPHKKDNYNYIMSKFQDLVKITSKK